MATDAPMPTAIDPILPLTQWVSPAFPVGAFSYSHGLEAAIDQGHVRDAATLSQWLEDVLAHGTGRTDAIVIRVAASGRVQDAHQDALARATAQERVTETLAMGRAFCAQLRDVWGYQIDDLAYPAAFGFAVSQIAAPQQIAIQLYLQAFTGNLIAAAQRLMPLGQTDAQRILRDLSQLCQRVATQTEGADLDDIASVCLAADLAALTHETQTIRIFRT